jgi:anti-sigma factor RsiW
MTLVPDHTTIPRGPRTGSDDGARGHVGELRLRRFRLGELPEDERESVTRHTADCGACRTRLASLEDEQRAFEREIAFPRFAGGVERAARVPRAAIRPRRWWLAGAVSVAAAAGFVLLFRSGPLEHNRIKGSLTSASIRVAAADGSQQRSIPPGAARLSAGERLRLGYRVPRARHLVALSIDDRGQVTPLYPESGASLTVEPQTGDAYRYLPDSIELTGAGRERIYLFLGEQPFRVDDAVASTLAEFARAGAAGLSKMEAPAFPLGPVEVSTWLFEKP